MRNPLADAGFVEDVEVERYDEKVDIGRDLAEAVAFSTAMGPAGEALRLAGEAADTVRPVIEAVLREVLRPLAEGLFASASCWIVSARKES